MTSIKIMFRLSYLTHSLVISSIARNLKPENKFLLSAEMTNEEKRVLMYHKNYYLKK